MDEYVYYWPVADVYCHKDNLVDYINQYGNDYECWQEQEFYDWFDATNMFD